jgi:hypothetical protein
LPALPQRFNKPDTLLQPQFAPDLALSTPIKLPEMFFWAAQTKPPRFEQPFQMPGHVIRPTQPRVLDAPPKLEVPVSEPAQVNVPPIPESKEALRLLTGPSLPVRTSESASNVPRTAVSADPAPGDPTTVLSLATEAARLREFLSVPPGNQLGQLPLSGKPGPVSAPPAGEHPGGNRSPGSTGTSGPGTGGTGGATAKLGDSEPGASPLAGIRAAALAAAARTRIDHPINGVFDIIVQSSGTQGLPESAGVLSGRPIYSVYLRTGSAKDWILQYCIPAADERTTEVFGSVVRLAGGGPAALSAPYPRMTMRPVVKPRPGHYVMVHGSITAKGRFQDLRTLGATDPYETEIVISVLEKWEFRPAMRDGKPAAVEVLLAIPAE